MSVHQDPTQKAKDSVIRRRKISSKSLRKRQNRYQNKKHRSKITTSYRIFFVLGLIQDSNDTLRSVQKENPNLAELVQKSVDILKVEERILKEKCQNRYKIRFQFVHLKTHPKYFSPKWVTRGSQNPSQTN